MRPNGTPYAGWASTQSADAARAANNDSEASTIAQHVDKSGPLMDLVLYGLGPHPFPASRCHGRALRGRLRVS